MKTSVIRKNLLALLVIATACVFAASALAAEDIPLLPVAPVSPVTTAPKAPAPAKKTTTLKKSSSTRTTSVMEAEAAGIPAFDGTGTIDEVVKGGFIIDDRTIYLAPGCRFRKSSTLAAAGSSFKKGSKVGYVLNQKKLISELWLLK